MDDDSYSPPSSGGGGVRFRSNLLEENVMMPGSALDSVSMINDDVDPNNIPPPSVQQAQELEQKYLFALETVRQLRHRLVRRTSVIEEIRKYYLRDIVTMKHVLHDVLSNTEREMAWRHYEDALPSLDLKQSLTLHAPSKCEFQVKPCEMCGGELEIIMKDTDEVDYLKKLIRDCKERENRFREKLATLDAQVESSSKEKAETSKSHMEEKRVLYAEMKKLKDEIEKVRVENATLRKSNKRMKEDHDDFMVKNADLFGATKKLDTVEKELDVLKINMEEAQESLRASKANEKAQLREIHTAKTEIKELQSTLEKSKLDLNFAVTEKVEMATTLGKAMETLETNKKELEKVNELNLDVTRRMQAMEADAAQLAAIHEKEMLEISKQIDGLRFEIKDLQLQKLEQEVVQQKLETALKDAKEEIDDLSEVNKNQELELLDNAEELEQFEEEIGAMQQFIRDRIGGGKSNSSDPEMIDPETGQPISFLNNDEDEGEYDYDEEDDGSFFSPLNRSLEADSQDTYGSSIADGEGSGLSSAMNSLPVTPTNVGIKKKEKKRNQGDRVQALRTAGMTTVAVAKLKREKRRTTKKHNISSSSKISKFLEQASNTRLIAPHNRSGRNLRMKSREEVTEDDEDGNNTASAEEDAEDDEDEPTAEDAAEDSNEQITDGDTKDTTSTPAAKKSQMKSKKSSSRQSSAIVLSAELDANVAETGDADTALNVDEAAIISKMAKGISDMRLSVEIPAAQGTDSSHSKRKTVKYTSKRKSTMRAGRRKRRDVEEEAETSHPGGIYVADPEKLLAENQPQPFEGVPNEKAALKRAQSLRRRSIPDNYVFRTYSKSEEKATIDVTPTDATITTATAQGEPSADNPTNSAGDGSDPTKVAADAHGSKAIIKHAKDRLQDIRQMFEGPQKAKKGGGGGESISEVVVTATKVNFKVKESAKDKEAPVPLDPTPDDATPLELWFRNTLLQSLKQSKYFTENACNRIVNMSAPMMHKVCKSIDKTMNGLWEGLLMGKRSLDFAQKINVIFTGIMNCAQEGITTVDLAEACAHLVPIAGSTLNANLTTQWQADCGVKDEVVKDLTPMIVNYDSGERRTRTYQEFFVESTQTSPEELAVDPKINLALESAKQMSDYSNAMNIRLGENLVEVLRDWSNAKSVLIDLDSRIEMERERVRKSLEGKISALGKELSKASSVHEKNMERIRTLEKKQQEYMKMEEEFKKCEQILEDTEHKLANSIDALAELNIKHNQAQSEIEKNLENIGGLETNIGKLEEELAKLKSDLEEAVQCTKELQTSLQIMTDLKEEFKDKFEDMTTKEFSRLNCLATVETQYEPDVKEISIQTEFITPPMDLKTVVVNKLSRSGMRKYPMVFSQSLDYLPPADPDMQPVSSSRGSKPGSRGNSAPYADNPNYQLPPNYPNPLLSAGNSLLSRQSSMDSLTFSLADFRASPPVISYDHDKNSDLDMSVLNTIPSGGSSTVSRQQYEEHAKLHSNPGISKISIADYSTASNNSAGIGVSDMYSPRSIGSRESMNSIASSSTTNTSTKGIKKGTTRTKKAPKDERNNGDNNSHLEVRIKSYSNKNQSPLKENSNGEVPYKFDLSEPSSPTPSLNSLSDLRQQASLRNNVSNAHQEIVNGIVYNYKANQTAMVDSNAYRTETSKLAQFAPTQEPFQIKTFGNGGASPPRLLPPKIQTISPNVNGKRAKGRTQMIMDDNLDTSTGISPKSSNATSLMTSSLGKAGLSTLNNDTMKKMQRELLSR